MSEVPAEIPPVDDDPPVEKSAPVRPEIRPASEPTCCGSDCSDCPF